MCSTLVLVELDSVSINSAFHCTPPSMHHALTSSALCTFAAQVPSPWVLTVLLLLLATTQFSFNWPSFLSYCSKTVVCVCAGAVWPRTPKTENTHNTHTTVLLLVWNMSGSTRVSPKQRTSWDNWHRFLFSLGSFKVAPSRVSKPWRELKAVCWTLSCSIYQLSPRQGMLHPLRWLWDANSQFQCIVTSSSFKSQ